MLAFYFVWCACYCVLSFCSPKLKCPVLCANFIVLAFIVLAFCIFFLFLTAVIFVLPFGVIKNNNNNYYYYLFLISTKRVGSWVAVNRYKSWRLLWCQTRHRGSDCRSPKTTRSNNINIWHDVLGPVDRCGSVAVNVFEYGVCGLGLRRMLELNIMARKVNKWVLNKKVYK